jgi:hypothetical protein
VISSPAALSEERSATLAGLADVLIPRTESMPSASDLGLADRWARRALAAMPSQRESVDRMLDEAWGKDPATELKRLAAEDPDGLARLSFVLVGAYYLSPVVRRTLGYPGPKRLPARDDEADLYLTDGVLDPVLARGPIYRPTPPTPGETVD